MKLNLYNKDCLLGMRRIPDASVDCVLTDPPYLYLKNQKLDRPFDEEAFFTEVKRILKKDGFIVLFGRGSSFYRWNTILADLGFAFKEEVVWDKSYITSPLLPLMRTHETISIHTKGGGTINRCKVPYLEMKGHDPQAVMADVKRMSAILHNPKSLEAVQGFLENNVPQYSFEHRKRFRVSAQTGFGNEDRACAVVRAMEDGFTEKSIIRTDYSRYRRRGDGIVRRDASCGDRGGNVMQSMAVGANEKSIIRLDLEYSERSNKNKLHSEAKTGDRACNVMQSMAVGANEKSIIKQPRDHYATIHPTQKPVRLLERLLALVSKEGALVVDPFAGSASTAVACMNTGRDFIGYEIDKEYFEAAMKRLKTQQPSLNLQPA